MFEKKLFSEMLIKAKGERTNVDYSKDSEVSRAYISGYINEGIDNPPSPDIIKRLADTAQNGVTYENLMKAAGYIDLKFPTGGGETETYLGNPKKEDIEIQKNITKVPILGRIRAGLPILANENWEGELDLAKDVSADFALRIEGDSMSWVGICNGDLALFNQATTAQHGDIVAAGVEESEWCATLKFYIKENGSALLRAANPNYKDMPITERHRIIGSLIGVYKQTPSIMEYKKFLIDKELNDKGWSEAIEKATQYGLENKQLIQLIELFSHMVKHVK